MNNVAIAFEIMGKGMGGIFVTILILSLIHIFIETAQYPLHKYFLIWLWQIECPSCRKNRNTI